MQNYDSLENVVVSINMLDDLGRFATWSVEQTAPSLHPLLSLQYTAALL
jgi:hypothetical protein